MINPELLPIIEQKVHNRWEYLTTLSKDNTAEGLKFLNLIHLAGMGGTLSFMGATKTATLHLDLAFACFFAGVTFVGIVYLLRFFYFRSLIKGWNADTAAMFMAVEGMTWGKVHIRDNERSNPKFDWALAAAITSLILFVAGGIFGFIAVLSYIR